MNCFLVLIPEQNDNFQNPFRLLTDFNDSFCGLFKRPPFFTGGIVLVTGGISLLTGGISLLTGGISLLTGGISLLTGGISLLTGGISLLTGGIPPVGSSTFILLFGMGSDLICAMMSKPAE